MLGGKLNELALFAGAGGGILGGTLLGWRTVCAVEIEPYPASVLVQRQNDDLLPPFPIWDDVRTFDGKPWSGIVDVISGGFPCQAFSTAAHGKNVAKDYWPEMLRVIGEVCPRFVFAENVCEDAIKNAQEDLEDAGYWTNRCKLSARIMGADHLRERFWLFADAHHKGKLGGENNAKMGVVQKFRPIVWETFPDNSRMANGMADRVDRFTAIGNGQVPAVARFAWNILSGEE